MSVQELCTYPVKGLPAQRHDSLAVQTDLGIEGDRRWALAMPGVQFDPVMPEILRNSAFATLMRHEGLARLDFNQISKTKFSVSTAFGISIVVDLALSEGRAMLEQIVAEAALLPAGVKLRLHEAPGHAFTDVSPISADLMHAVSIVNTATIRQLEGIWKRAVSPARFRANIVVDLGTPWLEFEAINKSFTVGGVTLQGAMRTKRCASTEVDPATGLRDFDLPAALEKSFGHTDLGIYAVAERGGQVSVGDEVILDPS